VGIFPGENENKIVKLNITIKSETQNLGLLVVNISIHQQTVSHPRKNSAEKKNNPYIPVRAEPAKKLRRRVRLRACCAVSTFAGFIFVFFIVVKYSSLRSLRLRTKGSMRLRVSSSLIPQI